MLFRFNIFNTLRILAAGRRPVKQYLFHILYLWHNTNDTVEPSEDFLSSIRAKIHFKMCINFSC